MPELIAKPALEVEPLSAAGLVLAVERPGPITLIAPFPKQEKGVAKALKPLGLVFPAANAVSEKGAARLVWAGRGQAMLFGADAPEGLAGAAAVTDQSDGWVCLSLTGARAAEALARLVPLDLRMGTFAPGTSARAGLNHMPLILIREAAGQGEDRFTLMTFRSMARTAWHEIGTAMQALAARDMLPG